MTAEDIAIEIVSARDFAGYVSDLADLLIDAVAGGAGVHFIPPLARCDALAFWDQVGRDLTPQTRRLFIARRDGRVVGTVQLLLSTIQNGPHRAEISKMLVHSAIRRRGIGAMLMQAAEAEAIRLGRSLLLLDTQTGDAGERLYTRCGFTVLGIVPDFALDERGDYRPCTYMYKLLPR